jgi:glycosyltransferase involved in cell wall biosynthesis
MNIAVILPSLKNKAPIQVAKDIAHQLIVKGCTVDVYYFDNITEVEFNCNIQRISLMEEIDFIKYDVVHSHMLRADFYVWWHRKKITAICVSTLHNEIEKVLKDYYNIIVSKIFTRLWITFLKSHDEVICLSKYAKEQLLSSYNLKKVNYIYNGRTVKEGQIAESDIDILLEKKQKFILLGVIANISNIKGIDQIIDSLVVLEDYCLIIVGEGPERNRLEIKAAKLNVKERCVFFGYRENAHLFLQYIDIYMMTSFSEGFPLVLLEAAQYKKAVVCSNLPIFEEFFNSEEVVFFLLNNIESLVTAIECAYSKRVQLSINIYSKYIECYSADIMGGNYLKRFKHLVGR